MPCTCPDMLDLTNRNRQVKTAMQAYERKLAQWQASGGAPAASESSRFELQHEFVEPAMIAAKDPRANTASANTTLDCQTTIEAPTACLRVLMEQHEQGHRNACRSHRQGRFSVTDVIQERWETLAEYAREEIEAYKDERIYIEAALSNLEQSCRYTLEFNSTIAGSTETTRSDAKTRLDLQVHFPRGVEPLGLSGSHPLDYVTKDVGPPKLVGHSMLMKLAKPCYVASQGSGKVTFEVRQAWLMRQREPPYGPLLALPIYVGDSQETRHLKGPRGCDHRSEQIPFWSEQFKLGKTRGLPADGPDSRSGSPSGDDVAVLIEDWNFSSDTGDEAEKKIEQPCAGMGGIQGLGSFAGMPLGGTTCEWTTLKMKRKR
jgi:hypothetical protein